MGACFHKLKKMNLKAQSILEYVVILGVVTAALTTMHLYLRRSVQSVIKITADEIISHRQEVRIEEMDIHSKRLRVYDSIINSMDSQDNSAIIEKGGKIHYEKQTEEVSNGSMQQDVWTED
ncbi:MAG: hypothetical protein NC923_04520 [Candidatus Omnitrophica bacterium]|nr:hypothetical protein [Candidatus Omnitrophota bacterium]